MSDKPSPWRDDEFLHVIVSEIGPAASGDETVEDSGKVSLASTQWIAFWKGHGIENDTASRFHTGAQATFNDRRQLLTLNNVPVLPTTSAGNHDVSDTDFFGSKMKQNENNLAGPFQNLKPGRNELTIWSGIPVIVSGQLPATSFNEM